MAATTRHIIPLQEKADAGIFTPTVRSSCQVNSYEDISSTEEALHLANSLFDYYHRLSGVATVLEAKYNI